MHFNLVTVNYSSHFWVRGLIDGGSYSALSVSGATLIIAHTLVRGNTVCYKCKKA